MLHISRHALELGAAEVNARVARIGQIHVLPAHSVFGSQEWQPVDERQARGESRDPFDDRGSADMILRYTRLAIDYVDTEILEPADDAAVRVANATAKEQLNVGFARHGHPPGIRRTIVRLNQRSNALIGVAPTSRSIVHAGPSRVTRFQGMRNGVPRSGPNRLSKLAYQCASRSLNRANIVMGLTSK